MKLHLTLCAVVLSTFALGIDFGRTMIVGGSNVAGAGGDTPNSFR